MEQCWPIYRHLEVICPVCPTWSPSVCQQLPKHPPDFAQPILQLLPTQPSHPTLKYTWCSPTGQPSISNVQSSHMSMRDRSSQHRKQCNSKPPGPISNKKSGPFCQLPVYTMTWPHLQMPTTQPPEQTWSHKSILDHLQLLFPILSLIYLVSKYLGLQFCQQRLAVVSLTTHVCFTFKDRLEGHGLNAAMNFLHQRLYSRHTMY